MTNINTIEENKEVFQTPLYVAVKQLDHAKNLPLPTYATEGSAGMDLLAAINETIAITPLERILVPTGLQIALPIGFEAQIRPRSGLALKHGLSIPNSPGTIDADYRGEIAVILINLGQELFRVTRGMRIAQMVIAPVVQAQWQVINVLPQTDRGGGGFGHTGIRGQ